MEDCDGWFNERGIPFLPAYQDTAVREVKIWDVYAPQYKKWLILCWFDTTYGEWNGSRFDMKDSRTQMAAFLSKEPYDTFEAFLEAPDAK